MTEGKDAVSHWNVRNAKPVLDTVMDWLNNINKKIQGKEITAPAENIQVNVIDMMEALSRALPG